MRDFYKATDPREGWRISYYSFPINLPCSILQCSWPNLRMSHKQKEPQIAQPLKLSQSQPPFTHTSTPFLLTDDVQDPWGSPLTQGMMSSSPASGLDSIHLPQTGFLW